MGPINILRSILGGNLVNNPLIGIDGRVFSTEASDRGMGRYVRSLIDYIYDSGKEMCLILYANNCLSPDDPIFAKCTNVYSMSSDPNYFRADEIHDFSYELGKIAREFKFSLYIDATPFILPARYDITECATVCVAYDLIPLRYPSSYLTCQQAIECYRNGLERLRKADGIITISQYVKEHLVRYLGLDRASIEVIYPNLSPDYSKLSSSIKNPRKGIFSILGGHKSKNTAQAISILEQVSSIMDEPASITVPTKNQLLEIKRITNSKLNFDCEISEVKKLRLQRDSRVVAHLSIEEGFGIPLLEALYQETKVLAIDNRLNREIMEKGGDYGDICYFHSPQSSTVDKSSFLEFVSTSPRLEYFSQLRRFFNDHWGEAPHIIEKICDEACVRYEAWKKRIVMRLISNTPANFCGVADYSSAIPQGVDGNLILYTADTWAKKMSAYGNVRIKTYKSFSADNADYNGTVIYNLAISDSLGFGIEILQQYGKPTDIVVVHDMVYFFGLVHYLRSKGKLKQLYEKFLVGIDARVIPQLQKVINTELALLSDFMPIEREFSSAWLREKGAHIISHSQLVRENNLESINANQVFASAMQFIPMGIDDRTLPQIARVSRVWRRSRGIQEYDLLFGVFGSVNKLKYLSEIASGIVSYIIREREKQEMSRRIFFLLAGKVIDQALFQYIVALFSANGLSDYLIVENPYDEREFDTLIEAANVVIACRIQDRVQMSHSLIRALSLGRSISTNRNSGFDLGNKELMLDDENVAKSLQEVIENIVKSPVLLKQCELESRKKFEANHRIESMVNSFLHSKGR